MTNPGEIIFREVPVPEVKENQVLVKIMNIGVCGSDIHVYHGKHPFTKYPVTQGHEVSGEITELGKNVTEFHVGQKVTIEPQVYCGHCYPCRHGKYNLCEELKVMGFQTTGTASEYFAVDASKVTPIPEDMSYEEGAMIEPLAVAVHGVKQIGDVAGMNIAVLGAGPIGNLVAQAAKGMGAAKVMITDISDLRLAKAKECGIDVCVNTKNKDFGAAMLEAFGPDKEEQHLSLLYLQEFPCCLCFSSMPKNHRLFFMHYLVSHSFFSLDLIPQSMQLFQTVWNMESGKPDLEMMVFSMHLFHLEIKSEWQLEQHF